MLFEYGPESVGTPAVRPPGLPRPLAAADFQPHVLRRGLTGQSGTQWFFTEAGRPFTLYVVLGSHARRSVSCPGSTSLLAGLSVEPAPAPAAAGSGSPWN